MTSLASLGGPLAEADQSMGTEILRPDDQDEAPTSTAEVEFALVLSRMIESVQNDPEHLRATIYELARHKIREQSISQDLTERRGWRIAENELPATRKVRSQHQQVIPIPSWDYWTVTKGRCLIWSHCFS